MTNDTFMCVILFMIIGLLALLYALKLKQNQVGSLLESFVGHDLAKDNQYPDTEDKVLLDGDYPTLNKKGVSTNTVETIWQNYPIFQVGSYAQVTNNIRYPLNPDDGQCRPAEFCGALYGDKTGQPKTNVVLPPVPESPFARVGYYNTDDNLLPFKNEGNILY